MPAAALVNLAIRPIFFPDLVLSRQPGTSGAAEMQYWGMVTLPVAIPRQALAAFCERNRIRKLSLFGSVLTEQFGDESDIDILVEFEPGRGPGLLGIAGMELELSELLGRKVDLRTPKDLSRYFREAVVSSAVLQYEREA